MLFSGKFNTIFRIIARNFQEHFMHLRKFYTMFKEISLLFQQCLRKFHCYFKDIFTQVLTEFHSIFQNSHTTFKRTSNNFQENFK